MALDVGLGETFGGFGLALGPAAPMADAAVLATINAMALKWGGGFFTHAGPSTSRCRPRSPPNWPSLGPVASLWTVS